MLEVMVRMMIYVVYYMFYFYHYGFLEEFVSELLRMDFIDIFYETSHYEVDLIQNLSLYFGGDLSNLDQFWAGIKILTFNPRSAF